MPNDQVARLAGIALDAPIAAVMRAHLPRVADRTVAAVVAEVPEYAGPLRGEMGANIVRAVELALATFLRLAEEPPGTDPGTDPGGRLLPTLEAAYALGRGEARDGRTMSALLSAYRVGARVSWEQWASLALEGGLSPERLVPFAALVFSYIDQLSAASVNGHSDELATTGRVRQQYLERLSSALIAHAPVDELEQRAERAGWTPPRTLTCLIGASAHTANIRSVLDPATLSLAVDAIDPAGAADTTIYLIPDVGRARQTIRSRFGSRAWALGPERPWTHAATSYQRAARVLDLYSAGPEVLDSDEHLAALVLSADKDAHADLRARALGPLAHLKPDVAERLTQTLRSWLLLQGRRDDVARDLHVHPQTVRYRMTQLREYFGECLNDPEAVLELILAVSWPPSA
jgi:PucR C-terminal helix-turn-helix domain